MPVEKEKGDIQPYKHNNNKLGKEMLISISNSYKFPLISCQIFFLLPLFKDIFRAVPLFNLALFQTDVFEVPCLCCIECRKSQAIFSPLYTNNHK